MKLSPRPLRIPLTCPCGAKLSVIPRLQGTEVKCPRCQEALLVPGGPLEKSAVTITSGPVESIPVAVATQQVQGSGTRDKFGTLLSDPAARLNAALDETIPKSLKTLREESGYQDVYNHIEQLLKEGKVRDVGTPGSRAEYIIDPDWLRRVQNTRPTEKTASNMVPQVSGKPRQEVEILLPPSVVSSTPERDTPDGVSTHDAAQMRHVLSPKVPKTIQTIMEESGDPNTASHIKKLLNEGELRAWAMGGSGGVGYTINPDWLKSVGSVTPPSPLLGGNKTPPKAGISFNAPVNANAETTRVDTPQEPRREFRPIGLTQPTRKQIQKQQPRSLFGEQPRSGSYATPDDARSVPASSGRSELTSSQKSVFDAVESSYALKGISPSIPELQTATSLNRFDTLKEVDALVRKGLFEFDRSAARGIRIIPEAERVVPPSVIEASIVFSPPLAASLQDIPQSVANLARAFSSQNPAKVSDVVVASDDDSAATQVAPVQAIPIWLEPFLTSALLDRQFELAGRRVPPREQIKALVLSMANRGFTIHRDTLCQTLGLPAIRYAGFLSIVMRLFNVDNVPILTRDDDGEMVRLNVDLLCRQFQITRP